MNYNYNYKSNNSFRFQIKKRLTTPLNIIKHISRFSLLKLLQNYDNTSTTDTVEIHTEKFLLSSVWHGTKFVYISLYSKLCRIQSVLKAVVRNIKLRNIISKKNENNEKSQINSNS